MPWHCISVGTESRSDRVLKAPAKIQEIYTMSSGKEKVSKAVSLVIVLLFKSPDCFHRQVSASIYGAYCIVLKDNKILIFVTVGHVCMMGCSTTSLGFLLPPTPPNQIRSPYFRRPDGEEKLRARTIATGRGAPLRYTWLDWQLKAEDPGRAKAAADDIRLLGISGIILIFLFLFL